MVLREYHPLSQTSTEGDLVLHLPPPGTLGTNLSPALRHSLQRRCFSSVVLETPGTLVVSTADRVLGE